VIDNLLDPIVLFFAVGLVAGLLHTDLRLPEALYQTLSLYLLTAIGLKGGVELSRVAPGEVLGPLAGALLLGLGIPALAFVLLRRLGRFGRPDAAALAAHYGSVSAVTFALALVYAADIGVAYEAYMPVLLVILEIPAIALGVLLARLGGTQGQIRWGALAHEVLLGKSIFLLLGGLAVGYLAGAERMERLNPLFVGLFPGALALFLLEMGIVASRRISDLRRVGPFLVLFGILMPILSALLGIAVGMASGLSLGGVAVLATLAGSASYIAAPAAMRVAVPEANPTLYLTASLGITFPFNVVFGIPLYFWLAALAQTWWQASR
jgi:hypothetical protein